MVDQTHARRPSKSSLLQKIQDGAADSKTDIADVLRQCAILAAKLRHEGFKKWVTDELNGYQSDAELPSYRVISGIHSIGHLMGPFGEQINNIPLPLGILPSEYRRMLAEVKLRQGVGALVAMVAEHQGDLRIPWPADLILHVADRFSPGRSLVAANMQLGRSAVIGVLDAVRNRVLKFALEIEEEMPNGGETEPGVTPVPGERVTQIFTTTILGGTNIAVGSSNVFQTVQAVLPGNLESLKGHLAGFGIEKADLDELELALGEDSPPSGPQPFGRNVAEWIGRMTAKAASGAWKIAVATAGNLLASAIRSYYRLP